jgi:hypothetical protein
MIRRKVTYLPVDALKFRSKTQEEVRSWNRSIKELGGALGLHRHRLAGYGSELNQDRNEAPALSALRCGRSPLSTSRDLRSKTRPRTVRKPLGPLPGALQLNQTTQPSYINCAIIQTSKCLAQLRTARRKNKNLYVERIK